MEDKILNKLVLICILMSMLTATITCCVVRKIERDTQAINVNITFVSPDYEEQEPAEDKLEDEKESYQEDYLYYGLTEDELNLVYAVVMQEGGPTYESAEYVMSTIINRVNNPDKWSWAGTTIIDQITYPQQYCYSLDDYWKQYLNGNVPDEVKNAVKSVIEFGPVHDYDCFRGYYLEGCEQVADNWYFIG